MKKLIALLLIAVLALSAAACSSQPADTQAPAEGTEAAAPADGAKVVKIGVFEPASGDNGAGGKAQGIGLRAFTIAHRRVSDILVRVHPVRSAARHGHPVGKDAWDKGWAASSC